MRSTRYFSTQTHQDSIIIFPTTPPVFRALFYHHIMFAACPHGVHCLSNPVFDLFFNMDLLWECVLATRPYTFTACLVPILVTTALVGTQNRGTNAFLQEGFLRALVMGISVQSAANLTNTYFDYINGVDTKDCIGGDLTLVEKKLTPTTVLSLSMVFYAVGFLAVMPILSQPTFIYIFALGIILSIFYTMNPIGLKYIAMGDITIFLCFGPLLMQATCLLVTGSIDMSIMIYSIPIGLLTEAILHANNTRDIQPDSKAKIVSATVCYRLLPC